MATLNLDKMFVLVINDFAPHGIAFVETGLADATFEQAVKDIRSGQYSKPVKVVEFNPIEGTARDITEEVMRVVTELWAYDANECGFVPWDAEDDYADRAEWRARA
jgi:hypothetical protein